MPELIDDICAVLGLKAGAVSSRALALILGGEIQPRYLFLAQGDAIG